MYPGHKSWNDEEWLENICVQFLTVNEQRILHHLKREIEEDYTSDIKFLFLFCSSSMKCFSLSLLSPMCVEKQYATSEPATVCEALKKTEVKEKVSALKLVMRTKTHKIQQFL